MARDDRARRLLDRPRRRLLHLLERLRRVGLVGAARRCTTRSCSSKGYKIQPYCARCGTTLSSHEVAQNYKDADDPSIWVLFRRAPGTTAENRRRARRHDLVERRPLVVAWTTTPWTMLAHAGIAVHPDLVYRSSSTRPAGSVLIFGDDLSAPIPRSKSTAAATRDLATGRRSPCVTGRDLPACATTVPIAPRLADGRARPSSRCSSSPTRRRRAVVLAPTTSPRPTAPASCTPRPPFGEDDYADRPATTACRCS